MVQFNQTSTSSFTTILDIQKELSVEDGLILKGTRIVIPTKQQEAILKLIHEGHLGLNKCKLHE